MGRFVILEIVGALMLTVCMIYGAKYIIERFVASRAAYRARTAPPPTDDHHNDQKETVEHAEDR